MSKTIYDAEKNILHIVKESDVKQQNTTVVGQRELRGFVVTVVNNEEELKEIQAGNHSKLQLSPVLAGDENEAIEVVKSHGKIAINVTNYEFLKVQTTLIEELAHAENVTLLQLDLFKLAQD